MAIAGPKLERPIKLANLLEVGLKSKPNEAALVSLERTWSWRELDQASTRLAEQYLALGLAAGRSRGLAAAQPRGAAGSLSGLLQGRAGRDAAQLSLPGPGDRSCAGSQRRVAVGRACRAGRCAGRERAGPSTSVWAASVTAPRAARIADLEELMTVDGPATDLPPPRPDAPAFIFFTSGSTGKPKGVTHSHETFGWMVASAIAGLGVNAGRRFPAGDVGLAHCRVVVLVRRAGGRGLRRDRAIVRRRRTAAAAPQHAAVAAVHAAGAAVRPGARPRRGAGRFSIHSSLCLRRRQDLGGVGARVHGR